MLYHETKPNYITIVDRMYDMMHGSVGGWMGLMLVWCYSWMDGVDRMYDMMHGWMDGWMDVIIIIYI